MKDFRIAVVQDSPVLFELDKTLDKIEDIMLRTRREKVDLIVFPEAFIPAYPRGLTFGTVVGNRSTQGRKLWERYFQNSLSLKGPHLERLSEIVKKGAAFASIGVIEKVDTGTLYCTNLYFNREGKLLHKHRKLKPTAAERIIWGEGDGSDLDIIDTEIGKMGGLICWENYMPLARTYLYEQAIEIYLAPTADQRDTWQHTLQHIATEGRCYVIGCNQYVTKADYPKGLPGEDMKDLDKVVSRGGSVIVDPMGKVAVGPLWDKKGVLIADLKESLLVQSKMDMDAAGHYARSDVFELRKKV